MSDWRHLADGTVARIDLQPAPGLPRVVVTLVGFALAGVAAGVALMALAGG